ncbi:MAG TPA: phenylalanine--tRNA ligase subunit beta, partial [Verrucomicrobiae bacterium]|nr:phenylalanine--tRNA ligase subunit beta [Verrucomicrobiae bacterium]
MKVTLNWLKQYVDFNGSPEELAERLTMLGLEVEGVHKIAGEFEGIVVAQILTRDKVPGSDKLSVCKVNDGGGERTIICGAQNHKPGDKVALILPTFALPLKPGEKEPFVIQERKVFGITSQGMMCSPKELGLAEETDGLLILKEGARLGQPFAEYLGRTGGDVVFDLEVTPNRPDLNSLIGIAREIAAATGKRLRMPNVLTVGLASRLPSPGQMPCNNLVSVRVEDEELCPRYTARVVKGVRIGPSPDWLRSTLEKVGIRSINNVVDVTNYVMLEIGQPLHAFDYHLIAKPGGTNFEAVRQAASQSPLDETQTASKMPVLRDKHDAKPTIVVRRAHDGELFIALDGQKRTLTREMLVIADEQKGIALAGIMGGANTEINERTTDVLIESAYFLPTNIRRTSKRLGLRSESSYRFERGVDISITDWASLRAAHLILQIAGGQLAGGVVEAYPTPANPRQITLRYAKTNALLGTVIPNNEQMKHLIALGFEVTAQSNDSGMFRVPTWRVDLKRETDLIEEIERLHGLEKVPATPPRGAIGANAFDAIHDQIADLRRILAGEGLSEAQGQTLISDAAAKLVTPADELVPLANPLSSDMNVLRPSLLP